MPLVSTGKRDLASTPRERNTRSHGLPKYVGSMCNTYIYVIFMSMCAADITGHCVPAYQSENYRKMFRTKINN